MRVRKEPTGDHFSGREGRKIGDDFCREKNTPRAEGGGISRGNKVEREEIEPFSVRADFEKISNP